MYLNNLLATKASGVALRDSTRRNPVLSLLDSKTPSPGTGISTRASQAISLPQRKQTWGTLQRPSRRPNWKGNGTRVELALAGSSSQPLVISGLQRRWSGLYTLSYYGKSCTVTEFYEAVRYIFLKPSLEKKSIPKSFCVFDFFALKASKVFPLCLWKSFDDGKFFFNHLRMQFLPSKSLTSNKHYTIIIVKVMWRLLAVRQLFLRTE